MASFLTMMVAGRAIMPELDVFLVMEIRAIGGWLILLPLVFSSGGFAAMRTARPWLHIGRNAIHYTGQFLWLMALTMIPLAHLMSIEFTSPIWGALLAMIFLGETMTWRKVTAIALGLAGVLIIVRPGASTMEPGHLVMLAGAVCFGITIVATKLLTRSESVVAIIFWMLLIQAAIGLIPAIMVWRTPELWMWPWLLVVSFTGMSSHFCLTRALSYADATVVMPMDYLRLPLAALIGYLLYSEQIDIFTGAGGLLILTGNLFNLRRKATETELATS